MFLNYFLCIFAGVLEEKVRYYEVLHSHNIKHRAKRSADHDDHLDKASRTVMLSMFNQ